MGLRIVRNMEALEEDISKRGSIWKVVVAILRSRYFLVSMSFYAILLVLIGSYQISTYVDLRGTFEEAEELLVLPPPMPPPPQEQTAREVESREVKVASTPNVAEDALRLTVSAPSAFQSVVEAPNVAPEINPALSKISSPLSSRISAAEIARLKRVRDFQKGWNVRGTGRYTQAEFTVYQAKYADGDWYCNSSQDRDRRAPNYKYCGDLDNVLRQIRAWSQNRLKANMHPEVLDVGTDEIFTIKPPFIYLTGHKDFHFLDREVQNLRDYLMLGGCIWADTALAGRRSRFDIAFRREMKKVLPDRDFEIVPPDHPMFDTFFQNISLPTGMNFYQEPAEMINIGDELAVLYTLNGYGHFWETRLNSNNKIEWGVVVMRELDGSIIYEDPDTKTQPLWRHVYGPHLEYPRTLTSMLYRNISDKTVADNYKFGINVVVHLLTRYQEKFRFLPLETETEDAYTKRLQDAQQPKKEEYKEEELPKEKKKDEPSKRITTKRIEMKTPDSNLPTPGKPPAPGTPSKPQ